MKVFGVQTEKGVIMELCKDDGIPSCWAILHADDIESGLQRH